MNAKELRDHFKNLLAVRGGLKGKELEDLIKTAVRMGQYDFYNAYPWAFRETTDTITATSGQETVDLPENFIGLLTVREKDTTYGRLLIKLEPEVYDRLLPDSASRTNNKPKYFKVYYNGSDGVWQLALYPTPDTGITLYINYHKDYEGENIPDKYTAGVLAAIAKYLAVPGSQEYLTADTAFNIEVKRLYDITDNPDLTVPTTFLTEYESLREADRKWYEPWDQ